MPINGWTESKCRYLLKLTVEPKELTDDISILYVENCVFHINFMSISPLLFFK